MFRTPTSLVKRLGVWTRHGIGVSHATTLRAAGLVPQSNAFDGERCQCRMAETPDDMLGNMPDMPKPLTLFCLHYLGGSSREFGPMAARFGDSRLIGVDLPGFGDSRDVEGFTVDAMAAVVTERIRESEPHAWMLVGHSMGAKVAAVIARQAEDGVAELAGLVGLVSLAGSPPSPEPIDDSKREKMLQWFRGDLASSRRQAKAYIRENVRAPLPTTLAKLAIDDVLRANPVAWHAWLTDGSREDWMERVGILHTPALIVAGDDDKGLGARAQQQLAVRHYSNCRLSILKAAGHLLPLECAEVVADLIRAHAQRCASEERV